VLISLQYSCSLTAREHGCSVAYVQYRIKRLRLWNRYSAYAA